MFSFFRRLFKKSPQNIDFDHNAASVPEAFGLSVKEYDLLVNDLINFINPDDRLASLDTYLKTILFEKYNLDLHNPKHAAVLGYSFCAAVTLQLSLKQRITANKVLEAFYPSLAIHTPKEA